MQYEAGTAGSGFHVFSRVSRRHLERVEMAQLWGGATLARLHADEKLWRLSVECAGRPPGTTLVGKLNLIWPWLHPGTVRRITSFIKIHIKMISDIITFWRTISINKVAEWFEIFTRLWQLVDQKVVSAPSSCVNVETFDVRGRVSKEDKWDKYHICERARI